MSEDKIKLTPQQKDVMILLRTGWVGKVITVSSCSAYLQNGKRRRKCQFTILKNLYSIGLLHIVKENFAINSYELTGIGKTIKF